MLELQWMTHFKTRQQALQYDKLGPRQDYRRRHPFKNQRIGPIAHQGTDQGVSLVVSHMDGQLTQWAMGSNLIQIIPHLWSD